MARNQLNISSNFFNSANYRGALEYGLLSLQISENLMDQSMLTSAHGLLCDIYSFIGKRELAIHHCLASLRFSDDTGITTGRSNTLNTLGAIYLELNQEDKSKTYFVEALRIAKEENDQYAEATAISNLGDLYLMKKEYEMALHYYFRALEIDQFAFDTLAIGYSNYNVGKAYSEKGDFENALKYYLQSLEYAKRSVDLEIKAIVHSEIGSIYSEIGKYAQAHNYLHKGLEIGLQVDTDPVLKSCYHNLARHYEAIGDTKTSMEYLREYVKHAENLHKSESMLRVAETEAIYDLEKKNKEIEILQRDSDISVLKAKQRNLIIGGLFLLGLLFSIIAVVLYRRNLDKNKANRILEYQRDAINRQKNEIEKHKNELEIYSKELSEKNRQITDSLEYARRIQLSLLPTTEQITAVFKESFVFYKPKEIIGGDFYWLTDYENMTLLVVGDCTGHGVPGSFMTVMANTLLNQIVMDNKIMQPCAVIIDMNKLIRQNLQHYSDGDFSSEGIDIAFCVIDKKNNNVGFCGCRIPMYIVKNGSFQQLSPNRHAPGSTFFDANTIESQTIKLNKGDTIYLSTDGFQDQFGGPRNKKFMKARFKNVLHKLSDRPINEQLQILDQTYTVWKGDQQQTDDLLVIGIKL